MPQEIALHWRQLHRRYAFGSADYDTLQLGFSFLKDALVPFRVLDSRDVDQRSTQIMRLIDKYLDHIRGPVSAKEAVLYKLAQILEKQELLQLSHDCMEAVNDYSFQSGCLPNEAFRNRVKTKLDAAYDSIRETLETASTQSSLVASK